MSKSTFKLIEALGYEFQSPDLLHQALSHKSIGKHSNERLEFLGDAVLNFVIGSTLFKIFPEAKEGELSRLRSSLVNGEVLAELAREFDLSAYLILGAGEVKSGGAQRTSILADTMEAVIGAIYLDSGIEGCATHVLRWYATRLQKLPQLASKDAKTRLQELLQAHKFPLPNYNVVATEGVAHAQIFRVECRVVGLSLVTVGEGSTKRKAEQDAAELFLQELNAVELSLNQSK